MSSDDIWSYYSKDLSTELSIVTQERQHWKNIAYALSTRLSNDNPKEFPSVGSAIAWASESMKGEK